MAAAAEAFCTRCVSLCVSLCVQVTIATLLPGLQVTHLPR